MANDWRDEMGNFLKLHFLKKLILNAKPNPDIPKDLATVESIITGSLVDNNFTMNRKDALNKLWNWYWAHQKDSSIKDDFIEELDALDDYEPY